MKDDDANRPRGLLAIHEARNKRLSGKLPAIPTRFLLWGLTILAAWGVFYWKKTQGEVESRKSVLFAKQRGVAAELGPKFDGLRQRLEDWTVEAAGPYAGDFVAAQAKSWDFSGLPGIYLRVRLLDATSATTLRKAAAGSLRDGFTACLFHEPYADPMSGPGCKASRDCEKGSFCNEVDHCMPPAQPYNLRTAYHGMRVLGDEWTVGLRTASDDVRMRLLEREFDSAVKDDIPLVIDLLTRAQFYLLVLDEDPIGLTIPAGKPALEMIQATPHPARVLLFGLKGGIDRALLRVRRDVGARFIPAGENALSDPDILEAQQRQVNSCQLALDVRAVIGSHVPAK
jgi:hypothetical protein